MRRIVSNPRRQVSRSRLLATGQCQPLPCTPVLFRTHLRTLQLSIIDGAARALFPRFSYVNLFCTGKFAGRNWQPPSEMLLKDTSQKIRPNLEHPGIGSSLKPEYVRMFVLYACVFHPGWDLVKCEF